MSTTSVDGSLASNFVKIVLKINFRFVVWVEIKFEGDSAGLFFFLFCFPDDKVSKGSISLLVREESSIFLALGPVDVFHFSGTSCGYNGKERINQS